MLTVLCQVYGPYVEEMLITQGLAYILRLQIVVNTIYWLSFRFYVNLTVQDLF